MQPSSLAISGPGRWTILVSRSRRLFSSGFMRRCFLFRPCTWSFLWTSSCLFSGDRTTVRGPLSLWRWVLWIAEDADQRRCSNHQSLSSIFLMNGQNSSQFSTTTYNNYPDLVYANQAVFHSVNQPTVSGFKIISYWSVQITWAIQVCIRI